MWTNEWIDVVMEVLKTILGSLWQNCCFGMQESMRVKQS